MTKIMPENASASVELLTVPELQVFIAAYLLSPQPPAEACRYKPDGAELDIASDLSKRGYLLRDGMAFGVDRILFDQNCYAIAQEALIKKQDLAVQRRLTRERLGIK